MEEATAAHRPPPSRALEMETTSRKHSATTGVWVGFDLERRDFRRGQSLRNDKVRRAPRWTGQIQAGHGTGG
jgi:hypothetical protein